ncbi:MAG: hypothetical protein HDT42_09225 [Ruminococcaceae bacterium]|nr:hypothetical protein [Oscillospiraceae bacterium]
MAEIRIGQVSDINIKKWIVRVRFPDVGITSGWLKVLWNETSTRREDDDSDHEKRNYKPNVKSWFPDVGDFVLCLYDEGFNSDGYVLGGLK